MPVLSSTARRFLAHIAAYALAGPVVSATIVVSAVAVVAIIFDSDTPEQGLLQQVLALPLLLLVAIPFAFLFGGLQALVVGVFCAAWRQRAGPVPLGLPLGLACLGWIAFELVTAGEAASAEPVWSGAVSLNGGLWLAAHLIGGYTGWWLTRRYVL